jgi:cytochrome oxidase Cu insertion factor (SCO1/SenC/PrrC family)
MASFEVILFKERRMKRIVTMAASLLLALSVLSFAVQAQDQQAAITTTNLKAGDVAPDFTLPSDQHTSVSLNSFRGKKNVIVAFYVLAFTGG